jgi:hypothetical protein
VFVVLLVLFVMVMVLWFLGLTGGVQINPNWLAWFACFFLGVVVFLFGSGIVVYRAL